VFVLLAFLLLRNISLGCDVGEGFKVFVSRLNPSYGMETITHATIKKELEAAYDEVLATLKAELKAQWEWMRERPDAPTPFMSCCLDMTTTNNSSYITLGGTYIGSDFVKKTVGLRTREFEGRHTAEDIAGWIQETTEDIFGKGVLPKHVFVGGTVDQGLNMINALELCGLKVQRCMAHRLNTTVTWGLGISGAKSANPDMKKLIEDGGEVVKVFTCSAPNNDALKQIQRNLLEETGEAGIFSMLHRNDTR
jgi:hypothetical protein